MSVKTLFRWAKSSMLIPLGVTESEANKLMDEGRQARRDSVVKDAYSRESSEFYWWSRGWLLEDEKISRGK